MIDNHRILLNQIVAKIFEAEVNKHKEEITLLVDKNDNLLGRRTDGFNHLGDNYGRNGTIVLNCPPLALELVPEISKLLQFKKAVEFDRQVIHQVLVKLIQPCHGIGDIRDTLPECVVQLHDWLRENYPHRTREPACSIQGNERDMRLYNKYLPKIETYCAMRLFY